MIKQMFKDLAECYGVTVKELVSDNELDLNHNYIIETEDGELYSFNTIEETKAEIIKMFNRDEVSVYMTIVYQSNGDILNIKLKEIDLC